MLAVLALIMLVGVQNAEAQLPTYDVYGIDTTYLYEYEGGQWYETLTTVNQVNFPRSHPRSLRGRASYRSAVPIQDCPPSGLYAGVLEVRSTDWYVNLPFRNVENYIDHCRDGNCTRNDYLESVPREEQQPALFLSSKAMVVGRIDQAFSEVRRVKEHRTRLKITATHTSGTKNFTLTIKYRVEGSTEVTTVQSSVVLKPGQKKSMMLFVPGSGSWASIDSITATEDRPARPHPFSNASSCHASPRAEACSCACSSFES